MNENLTRQVDTNFVILNNQLIRVEEAKISINDRGLLLGEGLFETMIFGVNGLQNLMLHWQRLQATAKKIGLFLPLTVNQLQRNAADLINEYKHFPCGMRLTITGGIAERGLAARSEKGGDYFLSCFKLPQIKQAWRLTLSSVRLAPYNYYSGIKSLSYLHSVLVKREALDKGFDDGIFLTHSGELAETSCANLFFIRNNIVITAPISSGILPGTVRARVFEICYQFGIVIEERAVAIEEIEDMEAGFITNALIGIVPIDSIDKQALNEHPIIDKVQSFLTR